MLITIGKVVKPWGVRGEVKIAPLTDHPGRFRSLSKVYLVSPEGVEKEYAVKAARYLKDAPLLLLEGFETPEKARVLTDWLVKIPQEEALPLPEGRYYWFELIGMEVVSEAGEKLGMIVDIFETGSNDVYVMEQAGREVYIPATAEVVRDIDRKAKRMTIHLMDGLLE